MKNFITQEREHEDIRVTFFKNGVCFIIDIFRFSFFFGLPVIVIAMDVFLVSAIGITNGDPFWFKFTEVAWYPFFGDMPTVGRTTVTTEDIIQNFQSTALWMGVPFAIFRGIFPEYGAYFLKPSRIKKSFLIVLAVGYLGFIFGIIRLVSQAGIDIGMGWIALILLYICFLHALSYISIVIFLFLGRLSRQLQNAKIKYEYPK